MDDEIIRLNVGGTLFTTSRSTLCSVADSMLANKFRHDSPFGPPLADESGAVFLDRNPKYFGYVLDYLRSGCTRLPRSVMEDVDLVECIQDEAEYFGLIGLIELCQTQLEALQTGMEEIQRARYVVITTSCGRDLHRTLNMYANDGYTVKDFKMHWLEERNRLFTVLLDFNSE